MSKALDDRLGVALVLELMKNAPRNVDLVAAFTVQEEIGMRGAQVAARHFKPDIGIAVDATPANDLPMQRDGENTFYNSKLGLGPAIYVRNSNTIDDPRLVQFLYGDRPAGADPIPVASTGRRRDRCGRDPAGRGWRSGDLYLRAAPLYTHGHERGANRSTGRTPMRCYSKGCED